MIPKHSGFILKMKYLLIHAFLLFLLYGGAYGRELPAEIPFDEKSLLECAETIKRLEPENSGFRRGLLCASAIASTRDYKFWKQSHKGFQEYLKDHKDDAEVNAYFGNLMTIEALFLTNPGRKMLAARKGILRMDKAVRKDANHLGVRLIRAINAMNLPPLLNRRKVAYEDLEFLRSLTDFNELPNSLKAFIYLKSGSLYLDDGRTNEGRGFLKSSASLGVPNVSDEAENLLKKSMNQ